MESARLKLVAGLVVDSSVLVTGERGKITTPEVIRSLRQALGDVPIVIITIVISALTVAEPGHGIHHPGTEEKARQRRRFPDELKRYVPIDPITGATAEIIARVDGTQAVKGITVPFADLLIGAWQPLCAIR